MSCVKTLVAGYLLCTTPYGQVIEPETRGAVRLEGHWSQAAYDTEVHFLARTHKGLWWNLTDEKIETAFADWGPRRHIPIDWSKVRGYQP